MQTFRIDIPEGQVKEPERVFRMQQEIRRKIAEIPGVTSVSFANSVPTDGNNSTDVLYAEDHVYAEGQVPPLRRFKFVTPGFFQTMGTPLVAGRDLTWTDLEQRRNVAMVSENMARELWRDPAGGARQAHSRGRERLLARDRRRGRRCPPRRRRPEGPHHRLLAGGDE